MIYVYIFISIIISSLVHECGHAAAALSVGCSIRQFQLFNGKALFGFKIGGTRFSVGRIPYGGYIDAGRSKKLTIGEDLFITIAGPGLNFSIAVILFLLIIIFKPGYVLLNLLAFHNTLLAVYSLLPLTPQKDGSRIIKLLKYLKHDHTNQY